MFTHLNFTAMNTKDKYTHIGCREEHIVRLHRGVRKVLRRIRNNADTAQNLPHTVRNHEQTVQRHRRTERRTVLRLSRLLNALGAGKRLAGCLLLSLLIYFCDALSPDAGEATRTPSGAFAAEMGSALLAPAVFAVPL